MEAEHNCPISGLFPPIHFWHKTGWIRSLRAAGAGGQGSRRPTSFVALLLLGKVVATTASVSSGAPGGVFTPTLLIGGASGCLYAHLLSNLGVPIGSAGGYALVGMAAATAASIHAPLLASVMAFEISGDYAIVLPLVLATALATLVSRQIHRESIYTADLRRKGIDWEMTLDGRRITREPAPPS